MFSVGKSDNFTNIISRIGHMYINLSVCNSGQVRDIHSRIKNEFFQYVLLNLERLYIVIHHHDEHQQLHPGFCLFTSTLYRHVNSSNHDMLVVRGAKLHQIIKTTF